MVRALLCWFILTVVVAGGISIVRKMTGKEILSAAKTFGYAAACSVISLFVIVCIVILF